MSELHERQAAAIVAAARSLLDGPRCEDCGCSNCAKVKAAAADFACETCGYRGKPATLACTCLEMSCGGAGADRRGSCCPHGMTTCPACDRGEADGWAVIRAVRAALSAEDPAVASEEAVRELRRQAACTVAAFEAAAAGGDLYGANVNRWYGEPLAAALAACGGDPDAEVTS